MVSFAFRRARFIHASLAVVLSFALAAGPAACAQPDPSGTAAPSMEGTNQRPLAAMPSFALLIEKVLPAVVNISATSGARQTFDESDEERGEDGESIPSPLDELLHRFFGQKPDANISRVALASGFIIDPAGFIVTNDHVVGKADKVSVIFPDGTKQPARIVGRDALTDLALLKIDVDHALPYVAWGDSEALRVGDWVLAVGNPFGLVGSVSPGIISARGRDIQSGPYDDFLQIDASINRGNSGGPAFNLDGQVIGITTAIYTPSGGSVGIAFAIPSSFAKPAIEQLRIRGRITRGWLGAQIQEITPELAKALALPHAEGALVTEPIAGGPGAKAGLRAGDVILSFNGHSIHRLHDLPLLSAEAPIGETAALKVWRHGVEVAVAPVIEEMPNARSRQQDRATDRERPVEQANRVLGLTLAPLTSERRALFGVPKSVNGVLVLSVAPDSPFAELGVVRGDVITMFDQHPVSTPQELATAIKGTAGRHVANSLVLVNRSGAARFVVLPLPPEATARKSR